MVDTSNLFTPVSADEVPTGSGGRRARKSGPILDSFIESGAYTVRINKDALEGDDKDKAAKSTLSSLGSYARNNELPVDVFSRGGDIYLRRMDVDEAGNAVEWTPKPKPVKKAAAEVSDDDAVAEETYEEYE